MAKTDLKFFSLGLSAMEKKLAEYKCNTNEAIHLKLGKILKYRSDVTHYFRSFAKQKD